MTQLLNDNQAWANWIAQFDGDDHEQREAWANQQPPLIASLDPNDAEDCNHSQAFQSDINPTTLYCPDCNQSVPWPQEP
jgi:hypothetical protein